MGPPIFAGGLVWVASYEGKPGYLYGLDPSTGAVEVRKQPRELRALQHAKRRRRAPVRGQRETADGLHDRRDPRALAHHDPVPSSSANPSPASAPVTFTAAVSPVPDSGTVSFTDGGVAIAGCGAVSVNEASGQASCRTTYGQAGTHSIVASYSGDPYYAGSNSRRSSRRSPARRCRSAWPSRISASRTPCGVRAADSRCSAPSGAAGASHGHRSGPRSPSRSTSRRGSHSASPGSSPAAGSPQVSRHDQQEQAASALQAHGQRRDAPLRRP